VKAHEDVERGCAEMAALVERRQNGHFVVVLLAEGTSVVQVDEKRLVAEILLDGTQSVFKLFMKEQKVTIATPIL
jgi:hypothetical protein